MDSRDNLWHDAYLILMHPIVKFIKRVGLILFKPATFAEQHLHLRDQTNFLRQARFFNEAAAYTLVASTLPAYLTKFAFLNSEYRYWLFITTQAFLCVGVIYLLARCFVGKSILLKDVVHVFLPVAAASMIAGTIFRVFYWGGSELLDLSAGPDMQAYNA